MRPFPVIISFYTEKTPYQMEAHQLVASCQKWGLRHEVKGIASFGSWELNCAFKPFFILGELLKRKEPLLWVDCDGIFQREPSWIEAFEADLSVRRERALSLGHPSEVISSTIYVNYTPGAQQLLRSWALYAKQMLVDENRTEEFWDQMALARAIYNHREACITDLPLEYAAIFDHPKDLQEAPNPIIIHYQASRRFKHLISEHF